MKKLVSLILILFLALPVSALGAIPAAAASDFTVEDGVLVRYSGSAESVTVPDGVYSVGASAFEGNQKIRKVTLPSAVYAIGDKAFYNCTALTEVIGASVSSVGVFAFNGTPYFEQSTDEFFRLGSCLLWYNGSQQSVTLPAGIVSIAPYAFLRCEGIGSFTAPEGLVSVGEGAFYGCASLSSVTLPQTVTFIGGDAFTCTAFLNAASGAVILGDGILVRYAGTETAPQIPSSVRRIGAGAFAGNLSVSTIALPRSVYAIDRNAFTGCVRLSSLMLNRGLVYIGEGAFRDCAALRELLTPDTLTYVGSRAFADCTALHHVGLNGSRLSLCSYAFSGCSAMRYALLSSGVAAVSDYAFAGCTSLGGISISSETADIGSKALDGCARVTVYCPEGAPAASALSACPVSTAKGDADGDGKLNIIDATRIQRGIADIVALDIRAVCVSDVDYDGQVTVLDATRIQRILADMV